MNRERNCKYQDAERKSQGQKAMPSGSNNK